MCLNKKFYESVLKPLKINLEIDPEDPNRFWMPLEYKDPKKGGKIIQNGKVKMQIDVLPADQADLNKVGKARDQPNHSPFLPQPEGRIVFTLNPFKMWEQMIGAAYRRKICIYCWCIICIALLVTAAPTIFIGVL